MEKSIKQILTSIETFSSSHKGIASFSTNPIQKNIAKGSLYPMLFVEIGTATIEPGQIRLNLNCYFLTIPSKEGDYVKGLSDMLRLSEDFMTYFNKNEETHGFYLSDTATAEPVQMAFDDLAIGFKLPIVVQTKSSENEALISI